MSENNFVESILSFHIWVESEIELRWSGLKGKYWAIFQARTNSMYSSLIKVSIFIFYLYILK